MTLTLPDYIIGAGGAGRAVTRTLTEQRWVLETASEDGSGLVVYHVDTDTSVDPTDDTRGFESIRDELTSENTKEGLRANHINLVDDVRRKPENHRLLGRNIASDLGLDAWWLEDDATLVCDESNYSTGVVSRRALTKALYHYGREDDRDPLSNVIQNVDSSAAMVVALGGGSGSGIFQDLAREIDRSRDANLTLFAILEDPAEADSGDSRANTYAALSELEYLALTDNNPFENIVLIPPEPSIDDREFDEAIAYTIVAYYNAKGGVAGTDRPSWFDESEPTGPPQFAPFTVAFPQFIRYPGETPEETENRLEEFLSAQEDFLENEREVLQHAEEFIETHYEAYDSGLFDNAGTSESRLDGNELYNERGLYDGRLMSVRSLLESSFIDELNYRDVEDFRSAWKDLQGNITGDRETEPENSPRREQLIDDLAGHNWDAVGQGAASETEANFYEFVRTELELIGRRAALLRVLKDIPDQEVTAELRRALSYQESSTTSNADTYSDKLQNAKAIIEDAHEAVTAIRDDANGERSRRLDSWETETEDDVEAFVELLVRGGDIAQRLYDLETALDDFAAAVGGDGQQAGWSSAAEARNAAFEFDEEELRRLNADLQEIGVEMIDVDRVFDSVQGVRDAATVKLEDRGILDRLWSDDPHSEYEDQRQLNIDSQVFELSGYNDPLDCEATGRIVRMTRKRVKDRHAELRERLADSFDVILEPREDEHPTRESIAAALEDEVEQFGRRYQDVKRGLEDVNTGVGVEEPTPNQDVLAALGIDADVPDDVEVDPTFTPAAEDFVAIIEETDEADFDAKLDGRQTVNGTVEWETTDDLRASDLEADLEAELTAALTSLLVSPASTIADDLSAAVAAFDAAKARMDTVDEIVTLGDIISSEWGESDEEMVWEGDDEAGATRPIDIHTIPKRDTSTWNTDGAYRSIIKPDQPGRLDAKSLAETPIWTDDKERRNLLEKLADRVDEANQNASAYVPLEKPDIRSRYDHPMTDYEGYVSHTVFLSQVFDAEYTGQVDDEGAKGTPHEDLAELAGGQLDGTTATPISDLFPTSAAPMKYNVVPGGGPWDFASVSFLGGVFLDNLRPARRQYKSDYERYAGKEISVDSNYFGDGRSIDSSIVRHTYGLDGTIPPDGDEELASILEAMDGFYVRRSKFIDFDDPDGLGTLLDHEIESGEKDGEYGDSVASTLLDEHVDRVGFRTTRPVDSSGDD
ncbi:MAG: tubulin-like doman-containing protein [Halodesulfurarchaeum sp.]